MKQKVYGNAIKLPDEITDVVPEYRRIHGTSLMHCHDFYEIEVIISGSGTQVLNGKTYTLQRGSVTLLSPSDFHEVTPHEEMYLYNFMFRGSMLSPKLLHSVWAYGGNKYLLFDGEELRKIISICDLLEWEHKKQTEYRAAFMKNILECFFMMLLWALRQKPEAGQPWMNDVIGSSIRYLHEHFTENPSLKETAAAVNLNPNYFSCRFREVTGQTYTEYLTNLKVGYAKKLLLSSENSVTEICFASGFTSVSNFMKVFKSHTGYSPGVYIKTHSQPKTRQEKNCLP